MAHHKPAKIVVVTTACLSLHLLTFTPAALGDWNPGDPAKWVQLPDLTPDGLDVLATFGNPELSGDKILADDFLCTATGPISQIHIWGSFLDDFHPELSKFHLSIHDNDISGPFSKPGNLLWSLNFDPLVPSGASFTISPWATVSPFERFFDPNQNLIVGTDTVVFQVNFTIPTELAFVQQVNNIYWLDVQFEDPFDSAVFGWKTRDFADGHFMDDAVYGDNDSFGGVPGAWLPLVYPDGDLQGQSIDLAFVLVPEPQHYAALVTLGLMGLAAWRRTTANRSRRQ